MTQKTYTISSSNSSQRIGYKESPYATPPKRSSWSFFIHRRMLYASWIRPGALRKFIFATLFIFVFIFLMILDILRISDIILSNKKLGPMKKKITTFHLVNDFHISKQHVSYLEELLSSNKQNMKKKEIDLYKYTLKELRRLLKKSKARVAQALLKGIVADGITTEDISGRSTIKHLAYKITIFLCKEEFLQNNNSFIENFSICEEDIAELNTILSKTLNIRFVFLNKSFFTIQKE
jgi:hypothetical protein